MSGLEGEVYSEGGNIGGVVGRDGFAVTAEGGGKSSKTVDWRGSSHEMVQSQVWLGALKAAFILEGFLI